MDVSVVVNPVSGGGRGRTKAEQLCSELNSLKLSAELLCTQKAGDAERLARDSKAEFVVSVGGDGTLNEVVNGLSHSDATVASLPMGTANVVARQLRLPKEPGQLAQLIADRQTICMDAGSRLGRRFLLGAGAGLDAAITKRVMSKRGRRSNIRKWIWPTIHTCFSYTFPAMRVEVDGTRVSDDAQYVIVGNCVYSAGVFPSTPRARIDDGLLDVCVMRNLSILRMLVLPVAVWRPTYINHRDISYVQGSHVKIHPATNFAVPLQIDGDPAGEVPAEFETLPGAIKIVAPAISAYEE